MPEVTCPGCGTVSHFELIRRDAGEFCRSCDYPLFWARGATFGGGDAVTGGDAGLRRLPGTAGRVAVATLVCPACAEPNLTTAELCIRCGADLRPKAPVPEPPPPPPVLVEPPPPPPPPKKAVWPWIVLGLVVVLAIVLVLAYA